VELKVYLGRDAYRRTTLSGSDQFGQMQKIIKILGMIPENISWLVVSLLRLDSPAQ
jgi:hypothetical protein